MIFQALYELAHREGLAGDPDFTDGTPVAWAVRVADGGRLLSVAPCGRPMIVPRRLPSRSGKAPPAEFAVDNPLYALGISIPAGKYSPAECARRNASFRAAVCRCAEDTGDVAARAVLLLLDGLADGSIKVALPANARSNDLVAFFHGLQEVPFHVGDAVMKHWRTVRPRPGDGGDSVCLVRGVRCTPVGKHPKLKKVPTKGKAGDIAMAPCNKPAFMSYGWTEGENAPISEEASVGAMAAFNRLLDPNPPKPGTPDEKLPRRNTHLTADTVVCYWARSAGDTVADMLAVAIEVDEEKAKADPNLLRAMYDGIWKGKRYEGVKPDAFYSLVLSGGQGRAVLRDWIETSTERVVEGLAQYFADLAIVRRTPPTKALGHHPPGFPLALLLEAVADPGERRKEPPPYVAAALYRCALDRNARFPQIAFVRALSRYRAELAQEGKDGMDGWRARNWNDARAAIIKAYLNRNQGKEIHAAMNPNCMEPGYVLGQLMAVLERLQCLALGDVNASVVDRCFSGASAAPKGVFVRLLRTARHHAGKAKDGRHRWMALCLERLIDQLCDQFVVRDPTGRPRFERVEYNGFPASLDQEQQGLFVIGYHQMRKWLSMSPQERREWETVNADAPRCYLWNSPSGVTNT